MGAGLAVSQLTLYGVFYAPRTRGQQEEDKAKCDEKDIGECVGGAMTGLLPFEKYSRVKGIREQFSMGSCIKDSEGSGSTCEREKQGAAV